MMIAMAMFNTVISGIIYINSSVAENIVTQPFSNCVPDITLANKCESGVESSCPTPKSDNDFYCPNAHDPGTCEPDEINDCVLSLNVPCGHNFGCLSLTPLEGPNGEEFVTCSGGPDVCI